MTRVRRGTAFEVVKTGDTALQLISRLPRLLRPSVRTFTFTTYVPSAGVEDRLQQGRADDCGIVGGEGGAKGQTADWFRTLDVIAEEVAEAQDIASVVGKLLDHDQEEEVRARFEIAANDLTAQHLQEVVAVLPQGNVLALCSRCQREDSAWGHIPMMDFHCPPTSRNREFLEQALLQMRQRKGVILDSGRSYHYYGFEVLSEQEWVPFLGACLLLTPFTDSRYIAHRLLGGACILRITGSDRKPSVPRVVSILKD